MVTEQGSNQVQSGSSSRYIQFDNTEDFCPKILTRIPLQEKRDFVGKFWMFSPHIMVTMEEIKIQPIEYYVETGECGTKLFC